MLLVEELLNHSNDVIYEDTNFDENGCDAISRDIAVACETFELAIMINAAESYVSECIDCAPSSNTAFLMEGAVKRFFSTIVQKLKDLKNWVVNLIRRIFAKLGLIKNDADITNTQAAISKGVPKKKKKTKKNSDSSSGKSSSSNSGDDSSSSDSTMSSDSTIISFDDKVKLIKEAANKGDEDAQRIVELGSCAIDYDSGNKFLTESFVSCHSTIGPLCKQFDVLASQMRNDSYKTIADANTKRMYDKLLSEPDRINIIKEIANYAGMKYNDKISVTANVSNYVNAVFKVGSHRIPTSNDIQKVIDDAKNDKFKNTVDKHSKQLIRQIDNTINVYEDLERDLQKRNTDISGKISKVASNTAKQLSMLSNAVATIASRSTAIITMTVSKYNRFADAVANY